MSHISSFKKFMKGEEKKTEAGANPVVTEQAPAPTATPAATTQTAPATTDTAKTLDTSSKVTDSAEVQTAKKNLAAVILKNQQDLSALQNAQATALKNATDALTTAQSKK